MIKDYSLNYIENAYEWYLNHSEHVEKIRKETSISFHPSQEDKMHPELWKPESWNWFFENYKMN